MSSALAKGAAAQAQAHAAFSKTPGATTTTTTSSNNSPTTPTSPNTNTKTKPKTTSILRPVSIRPTPLAQTARHALPALLAVLFAARFGALVDEPVAAMASGLPVTAALQVGYAVVCLPAPGSGSLASKSGGAGAGGSGVGEKQPLGGKGRKGGGGEGVGGRKGVVTALLSLILSLLVTPFLYITMVLFGAPFLTHGAHTFLCAAHLAVLALFPLFYIHGVDGSAWAVVGGFAAPLDETFGGLVGAVVGAWLGAVPIPLDWDREWQKWPVTVLAGLYGGYVLGRVVGGTVVWGKTF